MVNATILTVTDKENLNQQQCAVKNGVKQTSIKTLNKPTMKNGIDLIRDPYLNKGTAFTQSERDTKNLNGLLPPKIETLEEQAKRAYQIVASKSTPLEKYDALQDIQDSNETLFFKVLTENIQEFAPIVYTPTIGAVCQQYSNIYRRPRGIWLTETHRGRIAEVLATIDRDIRLIVVTDNERILGLGDLGAGGMGIPVGKLNLYTAGAGIRPEHVLPISIDLGCNIEKILENEHYLGEKKERTKGDIYNEYIEEFMVAVFKRWPQVLLQFEDFWKTNAQEILDRYRHRFLSFNDDIQGTAAVGVAGVFAGYRFLKKDLSKAKIVMMGGGAAGIGILNLLEIAIQRAGCTNAKPQILALDSQGLISHSRPGAFRNDPFKGQYAWTAEMVEETFGKDKVEQKIHLEEVLEKFKPDVLIGTSGTPNVFTEKGMKLMAEGCERPIIMPMSNPTHMAEAKPVDINEWTGEKALIATGSPFPAVVQSDGKKMKIGQGNNVFVFPGIGLGAILAKSKEVTDNMLMASAMACAEAVTQENLESGSLYPDIARLRDVSKEVAKAVVKQAIDDGLSSVDPNSLDELVEKNMWVPKYE